MSGAERCCTCNRATLCCMLLLLQSTGSCAWLLHPNTGQDALLQQQQTSAEGSQLQLASSGASAAGNAWRWLHWLWPFGQDMQHRRPGYRWDEFLFRKHDSFGEDAAEQAAKENLQRLGRRPGEREGAPEEVDTQQMPLLPLQLRPVGDGGAQRSAQSVDARATLQRMALLAAEEGLDAGGSLGDSVPWTNFTDSEMMPLLPYTVMWLVAEAEARFAANSTLNLQLALDLARLQSVAYCWPGNGALWHCTRCQGHAAAGFIPEAVVYDEGWDLFGYAGWSPPLGAMVVAFRGTDSHSIYNWAENMRYWRTDFDVPFPGSDGAMVHTGFYVSYNDSSLEPNITAAVRAMAAAHPGAPLYALGHSMGAALATICAMDVKFKANLSDVRLFTFGSPRVGNDKFAAFVANQTTASWRFTHNRDIVPSWPPTWVGFHHVAREVWQVDFDGAGVLGVCDGSGEDPRCHNSVCYLGLCTSVSDHLLYLGAHMYNTGC